MNPSTAKDDISICNFLSALGLGQACLHPTDTIPGLTFDPTIESKENLGLKTIMKFKGRSMEKPFVCLCSSLTKALDFWKPLPGSWKDILTKLWPGPITVIWSYSSSVPCTLLNNEGMLAIRVPSPKKLSWFFCVLEKLPYPLPSTSINRSGEEPLPLTKALLKKLSKIDNFFVPPEIISFASDELPSTIIKLSSDGGYFVLREGAIKVSTLKTIVGF